MSLSNRSVRLGEEVDCRPRGVHFGDGGHEEGLRAAQLRRPPAHHEEGQSRFFIG